MRKYFLFAAIILFSKISYCQNHNVYVLKWKLQPNESIIYKTQMEKIDSSDYKMFKLNINSIINSMPDSIKQKIEIKGELDSSKINEFYNSFSSMNKNYNLYSIISANKDKSVDVKMILKKSIDASKKENSLDSLVQMMTQNNGGVVLRGEINEDGSIGSFYLRQRQKNLLAMLFELPAKPVRIGDVWSLEINLLEFDQNFICTESNKKNTVELMGVKEVNNEEIAYLKYDVNEMVRGDFYNPLSGKAIPTYMEMSFNGVNEFSITKGRWKKFDCVTKTDASGFSEAHQIETDVMVPIDNISLDNLINK